MMSKNMPEAFDIKANPENLAKLFGTAEEKQSRIDRFMSIKEKKDRKKKM